MTTVALSSTPTGQAVLTAVVTDHGKGADYPVAAGELVLPASPAEISADWLPGLTGAAKEVAWQLLDVIRQAGHWGMITVTEMSMHLLSDARRPVGRRVGFRHHPLVGDSDWELLGIFRDASAELKRHGYVTCEQDNQLMSPTPQLAHAVSS